MGCWLMLLLVTYAAITTAQSQHTVSKKCLSYKCNETDPNCGPVGSCNDGYRTCCDHKCYIKQRPCPQTIDSNQTTAHVDFLSKLNRTAYLEYLESVKSRINAWASENLCWPEEHCINATTCKPGFQHCPNNRCAEKLSECEMFWETRSYAEESTVSCYPKELCFRNNCHHYHRACDDGECIREQLFCRGGPNCKDGSDEMYCDGKCFPKFRCNTNETCLFGFFACGNGECILEEQVCDTVTDCWDGLDESNCAGGCWPEHACDADGSCARGYFQCDGGKCIDNKRVCDKRADCKDGSDEVRSQHGFKCASGSNFDTCVIPQEKLDGGGTCLDFKDQCMKNSTDRCVFCLDGRLRISNTQICDGVIDCFDMSDECYCENSRAERACEAICLHDSPPEKCECEPGQFDCRDGTCLSPDQVCNGVVECRTCTDDEEYCQSRVQLYTEVITCPGDAKNYTTISATLCDGRPECFDLSDECGPQCPSNPPFCVIRSQFSLGFEFLCDSSYQFFDAGMICDGKWSPCSPRFEEEEIGCPARHYCSAAGGAISIDIHLLCDGIPQCKDMSDEVNCTDRFYCENGYPYSIPIGQKLDGQADCSDFSDECPREKDKNALSSRKELLGATAFRVTTWIIGMMAVVGNLVTLVYAAKNLLLFDRLSAVSKSNYIMLLNLSMADMLMGFYLITLSIKGAMFSGNYCRHDILWRTSEACASLGSLALISSEASMLILLTLTTFRLFLVKSPFKAKYSSHKAPTVSLCLIWVVAILLGVIPRVPSAQNYFTSHVWLPTNYTHSEMKNKAEVDMLVQRLAVLNQNSTPPPENLDWISVSEYLETEHPEFKIKGYFGYFSENSVCLPKFFASPGEAGWEFSIGIILFNFFGFVYMLVAYAIVIRSPKHHERNKVYSKRFKEMQARVARLVLTDFLCWVPICLMSFLQLGGVDIPDGTYAFSAVVLLPINSALNPLLYSDVTVKQVWAYVTSLFKMGESALCNRGREEVTSQGRSTEGTGVGSDSKQRPSVATVF